MTWQWQILGLVLGVNGIGAGEVYDFHIRGRLALHIGQYFQFLFTSNVGPNQL